MYIGVVHNIRDKETWNKELSEFDPAGVPGGYANPISYIGAETERAFCLWTGPSIEGLQPWLDEVASAADNEYFEVDPTALGTEGIPQEASQV
jgi:hypothetical protein